MKCSMKLLYKLNSNNIKYQDDTVSATVIHMSFLSVAFDKKGIMFLLICLYLLLYFMICTVDVWIESSDRYIKPVRFI